MTTRFFVRLTSDANKQPMPEAVQGSYQVEERYPVSDPASLAVYHGNPARAKREWGEQGTNYKVDEQGHIVRTVGEKQAWFLDVDSVEQLLALSARYGDLGIGWHGNNIHSPQLEIYDLYQDEHKPQETPVPGQEATPAPDAIHEQQANQDVPQDASNPEQ